MADRVGARFFNACKAAGSAGRLPAGCICGNRIAHRRRIFRRRDRRSDPHCCHRRIPETVSLESEYRSSAGIQAMNPTLENSGVAELAAAIRSGAISAVDVTRAALDRIGNSDGDLNCFTQVLPDRALAEASAVDKKIAAGEDPGPLAGVPFAAKNLFDIRGIPTLAGSIIRADAPAAQQDAAAITSLNQAGAVLVGALNMDEFAYGFTTENSHYGATHNPHDLTRVAGGSSGGSAAAVAAGLVPLTLGSDTNGSIRVPSSFCGIFGLKPTYGRLSRRGAFLFVSSLDHVGPFARSAEDLAAAYDILQGPDPQDPVCTMRPAELCLPALRKGSEG